MLVNSLTPKLLKMKKIKSVMEKDIGPHDCEMTCYMGYQIYAVCKKCGKHDYVLGVESEDEVGPYLKYKYPTARWCDLVTFDEPKDIPCPF